MYIQTQTDVRGVCVCVRRYVRTFMHACFYLTITRNPILNSLSTPPCPMQMRQTKLMREQMGQVPSMLRQLRDKGSVPLTNPWCYDPAIFSHVAEAVDHVRTHELEVRA